MTSITLTPAQKRLATIARKKAEAAARKAARPNKSQKRKAYAAAKQRARFEAFVASVW